MNTVLLVPALNESDFIDPTLQVIKDTLASGIVTDAAVLDSGSDDDTAQRVGDAGVRCIQTATVCVECSPVLGKGDSLWRGMHAMPADVYVFLDADLGNITADHIAALVEPLHKNDAVQFVKSGFVRVDENGVPRDKVAGRVTEEVGRPLAALEHPRLADLSQPLSGQVAVRAQALKKRAIATGYGLEIAMLIDMWRAYGTEGITEVQWGPLFNRWKPDEALTEVRNQVLAGAALRGVTLEQFGVVRDAMVVDRLI